MMLLAQLLLAHFIGDFVLQPAAWVEEKEKRKARSPKLYFHVLIHFALIILFVSDLDFWLPALLITLAHLITDATKLYAQRPHTKQRWFFIDQVLHIAVLLAVWWVYAGMDLGSMDIHWPHVLYVAVAVVFLSAVTSIVLQVLLSNFAPERSKNASLANAGKYIGMLERLLVLVFVLSGQWSGVGFLLAAKSVFRFGDLREAQDRKLTEYIMIGTLLSFGLAIVTALVLARVLRFA